MSLFDWLSNSDKKAEDLARQIDQIEPELRRREYRCSRCQESGHNIRTCGTVQRLRHEVKQLRAELAERDRELKVAVATNASLLQHLQRLESRIVDLETRMGPRAMDVDSWH